MPRLKLNNEWMRKGNCAKLSREYLDQWFFPDKVDAKATREAKGVCANCPVVQECFVYAVLTKEGTEAYTQHIVWGGMTFKERFMEHQALKDSGEWDALIRKTKVME